MKAVRVEELIALLKNATQLFSQNVEEVNKSNHFPVSDFDTGENIYHTLKNALADYEGNPLLLPELFILHSHGNSGIILGQILAGFFEVVNRYGGLFEEAQVCEALALGKMRAYSSVLRPKEGTMLSFIRILASFNNWDISQKTLEERILFALENTKEVDFDAGAKGLYYIIKYAFNLSLAPLPSPDEYEVEKNLTTFKYCTELLCKLFPDVELDGLLKYLEGCGDSINYSQVKGVFKLHVHTNDPFAVFEEVEKIGNLTYKKIDNMYLESEVRPKIALVVDMEEGEELFPEVECEYLSLSSLIGEKELAHKISSIPYAEHIVLLTDHPERFENIGKYPRISLVKTFGFASRYTALSCVGDWCAFEVFLKNVEDLASSCKSCRLRKENLEEWLATHPYGVVLGGERSVGALPLKYLYGVETL